MLTPRSFLMPIAILLLGLGLLVGGAPSAWPAAVLFAIAILIAIVGREWAPYEDQKILNGISWMFAACGGVLSLAGAYVTFFL